METGEAKGTRYAMANLNQLVYKFQWIHNTTHIENIQKQYDLFSVSLPFMTSQFPVLSLDYSALVVT